MLANGSLKEVRGWTYPKPGVQLKTFSSVVHPTISLQLMLYTINYRRNNGDGRWRNVLGNSETSELLRPAKRNVDTHGYPTAPNYFPMKIMDHEAIIYCWPLDLAKFQENSDTVPEIEHLL